ncbi:MAG TPA: outer membrane protein transport protein, partial [Bacteroidales bacterium]|nr:outer membrane protein transport protein [Bacteroidales bacterium]
ILFASMCITGSLFAGGLVTNNNQSALFTRLQNRNASTAIDAAFYNPAGLTKLGTGFFASINNQFVTQTKTVTNNYQYLSGTKPREYVGDVKAPLFPGVYAAFNTGKFSFSAGINPVGGGGGAKYNTGLPSFEMGISELVPKLQSQLQPLATAVPSLASIVNITGYSADIFFEGTSVYFGYQANVAYKLNDMISVALGARLVSAKNTYSGYVRSVQIDAPAGFGGNQAPGDYLRTIAGFVPDPYKTSLNGTATVVDAATALEADVEETGSGIAPIISVNISPIEMLNVALKYEFATKLELTTKVNGGKNAGGLFVDGSKYRADMPALLAFGAELKPIEKLMVTASFNTYFDKSLDTRAINSVTIDKNFMEYGLGAEYSLTDKLRVSAGWLSTATGVNQNYQNDQTYSTNTNSFGAGLGFRINDMIDLNLGGQYTVYADDTKNFSRQLTSTIALPVTETYSKKTWIIGAGIDFRFGGKK